MVNVREFARYGGSPSTGGVATTQNPDKRKSDEQCSRDITELYVIFFRAQTLLDAPCYASPSLQCGVTGNTLCSPVA